MTLDTAFVQYSSTCQLRWVGCPVYEPDAPPIFTVTLLLAAAAVMNVVAN